LAWFHAGFGILIIGSKNKKGRQLAAFSISRDPSKPAETIATEAMNANINPNPRARRGDPAKQAPQASCFQQDATV
jgi:hypothetical protein